MNITSIVTELLRSLVRLFLKKHYPTKCIWIYMNNPKKFNHEKLRTRNWYRRQFQGCAKEKRIYCNNLKSDFFFIKYSTASRFLRKASTNHSTRHKTGWALSKKICNGFPLGYFRHPPTLFSKIPSPKKIPKEQQLSIQLERNFIVFWDKNDFQDIETRVVWLL